MQLSQTGKMMLEELNIQELTTLVERYPWYPHPRRELCSRLLEGGDEQWKKNIFATHAIYMPDRGHLFKLYLKKKKISKSVSIVIESPKPSVPEQPQKEYHSDPRVTKGGDFFSAEEYAGVSGGDYSFKVVAPKTNGELPESDIKVEFFTETLAEIYAEQGYIAQAKQIYNQLLLANPEKSAYFASLIEKLNKSIQ